MTSKVCDLNIADFDSKIVEFSRLIDKKYQVVKVSQGDSLARRGQHSIQSWSDCRCPVWKSHWSSVGSHVMPSWYKIYLYHKALVEKSTNIPWREFFLSFKFVFNGTAYIVITVVFGESVVASDYVPKLDFANPSYMNDEFGFFLR